nr:MAG TPA_asm: hypothetical protein [Caudoviricetes sp.]
MQRKQFCKFYPKIILFHLVCDKAWTIFPLRFL